MTMARYKRYNQQALKVDCPRCGVEAGYSCSNNKAQEIFIAHSSRYTEARKIKEEARVLKQRGLGALSLEN